MVVQRLLTWEVLKRIFITKEKNMDLKKLNNQLIHRRKFSLFTFISIFQ
jgi:hypothetical protein